MSTHNLPSPYEVARLAAALRGREAAKRPEEASGEALRLWLAAAEEVAKATKRCEGVDTAIWQTRQAANADSGEQRLQISLDKNGISEAIEWLNADPGTHRLDKFDRFATFIKAWCKFEIADGQFFLTNNGKLRKGYDNTGSSIATTVERLKQFRRTREEQRRAADAESKRQKRGSTERRKTLSNKSRKIVAGHSAKVPKV